MKKCYFVIAFAGLFCFATPSFSAAAAAAVAAPAASESATAVSNDERASALEMEAAKTVKDNLRNMSAKEKREMRKEIKKAVRDAKNNGSDTELLLLVILAILLPPLAMALYDGISTRFWISLILTLLGFLPGVIYTLIVILGGN